MASSGYLMFGNLTLDEITKNLAQIPSYDRLLNNLTIWLIAINPATKFALTLQPVAVNLELWMLCCSTAADPYEFIEDGTKYAEYQVGPRLFRIRFGPLRIISRTLLSFAVVLIAIVYPGFERIIGLLGSLFSFMVSAVFPLVCYYKLFYSTIGSRERVLLVVLIALTGSMAALGTAWSFLPESVIGA
jgi:vesicular inhibitory amino acid transporter